MEWMKVVGDAIDYIETHITEELSTEAVAKHVCISPFYFQKGFGMLCGYTVSEYIRNRRLALAGGELTAGDVKIIDLALKYGYDSPDSFTKAFTRFHGITPSMARKEGVTLKSFAPLKLTISLKGGYLMDYRITKKESFTVLGVSRIFSYENAKQDIPAFWEEHYAREKCRYVEGRFGINIDSSMGKESFTYLIADLYDPAADIPEGFEVTTIPSFAAFISSPTISRTNSPSGFSPYSLSYSSLVPSSPQRISSSDCTSKSLRGLLPLNFTMAI